MYYSVLHYDMLCHIISYYSMLYHSRLPVWGNMLHTRKSTPQKSSPIFSGMFQWTFGGVFKRILTCRRYFPKDCHLSSGCLLNAPMDFQWHFPTGFRSCDLWCVIFAPNLRLAVSALEGSSTTIAIIVLTIAYNSNSNINSNS